MPPPFHPAALLLTLVACAGHAQQCRSERVAASAPVLERFINADCETCWRDPATPSPPANGVAIDWIVPGARGDDAPLAAAATRDAFERLESAARKPPGAMDSLLTRGAASNTRVRIRQGQPFNDYVGGALQLDRAGPGSAWLLLVEELPAGLEGSPVARNLVRNTLHLSWPGDARRAEHARSIRVPEGANRARLRMVALVYDARGRLVAASRTRCETTE